LCSPVAARRRRYGAADALFGTIGLYTHLATSVSVGEHLFAVVGVIVVLIAGTI
jgi:hypothetical protein